MCIKWIINRNISLYATNLGYMILCVIHGFNHILFNKVNILNKYVYVSCFQVCMELVLMICEIKLPLWRNIFKSNFSLCAIRIYLLYFHQPCFRCCWLIISRNFYLIYKQFLKLCIAKTIKQKYVFRHGKQPWLRGDPHSTRKETS